MSWTPAFGRPRGQYYHGLLYNPNCAECPLQTDTKVLPDGPVPARIALVGEEPGKQEVAAGKGFIGPSGYLLWQMCKEIGLEREEVWVTNAALCRARDVILPNGARTPLMVVKAMAAKACRERLIRELAQVDPVVIVPLGNWALWALSDIPNARIYSYRGSRIETDLETLADRVARGQCLSPMRQIKEE